MTRIKMMDRTIDALVKMADGNPGAINVLMRLVTEDTAIGMFTVFMLDEAGIYGPDIWIGYKDICGENLMLFAEKANDGTLKGLIDAEHERIQKLMDEYRAKP